MMIRSIARINMVCACIAGTLIGCAVSCGSFSASGGAASAACEPCGVEAPKFEADHRILIVSDGHVPQAGSVRVYRIDGSVEHADLCCGYLDIDWEPLTRAEIVLDSGRKISILDVAGSSVGCHVVRLAPVSDVEVHVKLSTESPWRAGAVFLRRLRGDAEWKGGVLINDVSDRMQFCDSGGVARFREVPYGDYEVVSPKALPFAGARMDFVVAESACAVSMDVAVVDLGLLAGWRIDAREMPIFGAVDRGRLVGPRVVCAGRPDDVPIWFDGVEFRALVSVERMAEVQLILYDCDDAGSSVLIGRDIIKGGVFEKLVVSEK
jgi:hypothetical protein